MQSCRPYTCTCRLLTKYVDNIHVGHHSRHDVVNVKELGPSLTYLPLSLLYREELNNVCHNDGTDEQIDLIRNKFDDKIKSHRQQQQVMIKTG